MRHSPPAPKTQIHHVVPKAWGGADTPENRIALCGTTHDAIHDLLNRAVKTKQLPGYGGGFGNAAVSLARRAVAEYLEATGGIWPVRYTLFKEEDQV